MKNFFTAQKQQFKLGGAGLLFCILGFLLSLPTFAGDKNNDKTIEESTINPKAIGVKMPKKPAKKQYVGNKKEKKNSNNVKATHNSARGEVTSKSINLRLVFQVDEIGLSLVQRKNILKLVRAIRVRDVKPKGYTFTVHAFSGPTGENTWLAQERLRAIKGVLREQGINLAQANVTEIYLHTKKVQYIQVLPQY